MAVQHFDTCERRGQIPQPQSTEFNNYIYIAFPVLLVKTKYIIIRVTFPESFSLENF